MRQARDEGMMAEKWRNRIVERTTIKAGDLLDHKGNWRVHPKAQKAGLVGILDEVGIIDALTVYHSERQGGLTVIDGHLRKSVDPDQEWPIDVLDVSDAEADYVLAIKDPLGAMAEADREVLGALLQGVQSSDAAVQAMLAGLAEREGVFFGNGHEAGDAEPQTNRADELREQWGVESGQLWRVGDHMLLCGDSTKREDVERVMGGEVIDAVFTDPPYGINYDPSWLNGVGTHRQALSSRDTLANDDGSLDLSFLWQYPRRMVWGFPYIYDSTATGWIVWDKQPGVDGRGIVTPIEMASTTMRKGFDMVRVMWGSYYRAAGEDRQPHPTQKPIGVFSPFIEAWTKPGEVIIDFFCGSGATMVACQNLGRKCRAIEISPAYVAVTLQRMQDAFGLVGELVNSES